MRSPRNKSKPQPHSVLYYTWYGIRLIKAPCSTVDGSLKLQLNSINHPFHQISCRMPELVTTTTGLIVSGCTISLQLIEFIKHVRSAPGDISVLASELQDFCAVLQTLEDNLSVRRNQEWLNPKIRGVLDSTVEIFNRLEVLVQNHRIESGDRTIYRQWKKWKWTFHEKEIASLSNHLGTHKMTLNFIILLSLR